MNGQNAFYDKDGESGLSEVAKYYIGGLLWHAKEIAAICNPTINSYKRLIPGYEAPTQIAWSSGNRSALIRIPVSGEERTRVELRTPDPTANPYLVYAVMLKAGLDGIKNKTEPPEPINKNIYSEGNSQIDSYPESLYEALREMENSKMVKEVLGEHTFNIFLKSKYAEWKKYKETVHQWELKEYFDQY